MMYAAVAVLATLLAVALFAPDGCEARSYSGAWKSSDGTFVASVKNNKITIDLHADDTTALYWKGTFKIGKGRTVTSKGDRKALDAAIFGSMDKTKVFVVKPHEIRFHFSIAGATRVVSLRRTR